MKLLYDVLLLVHVATGSLALGAALGAIAVAKGQKWHRRFGLTYAMGMGGVCITALAMSMLKPNVFLFVVGVFSAFMVLSGYARAKNRSGTPASMEWFLAAAGGLTSAAMFWYAWGWEHELRAVLFAFSAILCAMALADVVGLKLHMFKGVSRIVAHQRQMLGGTIATVTAVAVVNVRDVQPAWLVWLAPTALIAPAIVYWSIRLRRTNAC